MKVLLVGEGPHDIGLRDEWCPRSRKYVDLEGWLQPIVRRSCPAQTLEIRAEKRSGIKIDVQDRRRLQPLPAGHGAKALLAKRTAIVAGCDLVVYMVDCDDTDVRRWREIVAEIEDGFAALNGDVKCVACVPMSASESWMLSDQNAWHSLFGLDNPLPARPEMLWGRRDDPAGSHPHRIFARFCHAVGIEDNRDCRLRLAEVIDLDQLKLACPSSFPPFSDSLQLA